MRELRIADCGLRIADWGFARSFRVACGRLTRSARLRISRRAFSHPELLVALFLLGMFLVNFAQVCSAASRRGVVGGVAAFVIGLLVAAFVTMLEVCVVALLFWISIIALQWVKCPPMNSLVRIRAGHDRCRKGRIIARKLGWEVYLQIALEDSSDVVSVTVNGIERVSKDSSGDAENPQSAVRNPQSEE